MHNGTVKNFDVIVVGGGPGGSVAAKKCADSGFRTLLVEKKRLPRDKVCSGMIMGPWANMIIREEFGDIPKKILSDPYYLAGHMIHVPNTPARVIEWKTPLAWRRDLDLWLVQQAVTSSVEIMEGAKVIRVDSSGDHCTVIVKRREGQHDLKASFVIAADGGASTVRRSLFPDLKVKYSAPVRECYKGSVEIEKNYIHWFFPLTSYRPRFDLFHRDAYFFIEGSGIRLLKKEIGEILEQYGVDPKRMPQWKDGCLIPLLHHDLVKATFFPAKGNVLLVGDAAGLIFPITFEGIGSALKSGLLAAEAVIEAAALGKNADGIYLQKLAPVLKAIRQLMDIQKWMEKMATKGAADLADALKTAYESTRNID